MPSTRIPKCTATYSGVLHTFPITWETGIWPITPFMDPRLIQLARGIPSKDINKQILKQRIWEGRRDIFVKVMI